MKINCLMTILNVLLFIAAVTAEAEERFEAAAMIDHIDFVHVTAPDGTAMFDTETPQGNNAILDYVSGTGANTILWRVSSGATVRYRSREESMPPVRAPFDKRRLPDNRHTWGWVRYYEAEPDILRYVVRECAKRDMSAGAHWPFEETHWWSHTFGAWNLEHPQFWGMTADGLPWSGRCSLTYPEVVAHRLRLVDEMIDRGVRRFFIDTWRTGGWSPAYEYVAPEIRRWKARYECEPPADATDPRWCAFVAESTHAWFAALRQHLDSNGGDMKLMLGVADIDMTPGARDMTLIERGIDWRCLVKEGIVDTLVVMSVDWDKKRPFESTREIYQAVMNYCDGHCRVLFPVSMYNFTKKGLPEYHRTTGLSLPDVTSVMVRMAWEQGADGIAMECVDYNNYSAATMKTLRQLFQGPCKFKRMAKSKNRVKERTEKTR